MSAINICILQQCKRWPWWNRWSYAVNRYGQFYAVFKTVTIVPPRFNGPLYQCLYCPPRYRIVRQRRICHVRCRTLPCASFGDSFDHVTLYVLWYGLQGWQLHASAFWVEMTIWHQHFNLSSQLRLPTSHTRVAKYLPLLCHAQYFL
jgi:hypothetical protein